MFGEARSLFKRERDSRLEYRALCACYQAGCPATPHPKKEACSLASFSEAFSLERQVRGFTTARFPPRVFGRLAASGCHRIPLSVQ